MHTSQVKGISKPFISEIFIYIVLIPIISTFTVSCSSNQQFIPPPTLPNDQNHIAKPKTRKINILTNEFHNQFSKQVEQTFDFSHLFRKLFNRHKQALNIDAFDNAVNSS